MKNDPALKARAHREGLFLSLVLDKGQGPSRTGAAQDAGRGRRAGGLKQAACNA
ncbi:MAG: hypothetical protein J0H24_06360 [Delftia acidovorans]|nr:hypothetical protein [Delftia acidovorans]